VMMTAPSGTNEICESRLLIRNVNHTV
jgi:hypothetical protein